MLSIPIADNVISYKKIKRNAKKNRQFYYVNSAPELRNEQDEPKNRPLTRNFLKFVYRYGIF